MLNAPTPASLYWINCRHQHWYTPYTIASLYVDVAAIQLTQMRQNYANAGLAAELVSCHNLDGAVSLCDAWLRVRLSIQINLIMNVTISNASM